MNEHEQRRVEIMVRLEAGSIDVSTSAKFLGVSPRHARRLRADFRLEGIPSVVHANRGRTAANRTDPVLVERVLSLAGPDGCYHDFNVCHLQDVLADEQQIAIARSTLDRILRQHGLRQTQRPKAPAHRRRRERRTAEGMLLQMDGSPFAWLEKRGPQGALLGAIDDATGKIVALVLRRSEDQAGYFLLLRATAQSYGLPLAIYHDRHTIFRSPKEPTIEEQLAGRQPMSQIQRLLAELGVESIPAYSPQAKGRIERLWGTLQDRLVKELRLAGIKSVEAANAFLPGFIERYNARFAKAAADPQSAWRQLPVDCDLDYHFSARQTRKVRDDHCLAWLGETLDLQVRADEPVLAGKSVSVHELPDGAICVYDGRRRLPYKRVEEQMPAAPVLVQSPPVPKAPKARAGARQRAWLFGQQ